MPYSVHWRILGILSFLQEYNVCWSAERIQVHMIPAGNWASDCEETQIIGWLESSCSFENVPWNPNIFGTKASRNQSIHWNGRSLPAIFWKILNAIVIKGSGLEANGPQLPIEVISNGERLVLQCVAQGYGQKIFGWCKVWTVQWEDELFPVQLWKLLACGFALWDLVWSWRMQLGPWLEDLRWTWPARLCSSGLYKWAVVLVMVGCSSYSHLPAVLQDVQGDIFRLESWLGCHFPMFTGWAPKPFVLNNGV